MGIDNAIELQGITKRFPGIVANDHISFTVRRGEILALAGENGAGKSTLMNILFGLLQPDEGRILINGEEKHFSSPRDSHREKIGMVHQHFMLVPKMTVTENVILGQEPGSWTKVDYATAEKKVQEISDKYKLNIDAEKQVGDLSVPEQQRVEIIKVLYREAEILIFDEPTAVLTPHLIDEFCDILLYLKKMGKTIIFISHKLPEVMKVADRVTIIRKGKVIETKNISDTSPAEIASLMVGHSVFIGRKPRKELNINKEILSIKDLHYTNHNGKEMLRGINLSIKAGEILGIAGVDGNGQEELEKCILGLYTPDSGEIELSGKNLLPLSIKERRAAGLSYVAEDRQKESLVLPLSVADNIILGIHRNKEFAKNGFWRRKDKIQENANKLSKEFDIRCANVNVPASTLSGGNQQKIVIAREASMNPDLYVAVQPTRGLDIGAMDSVQNMLMQIRDNGKAVLLVSMELDEILAVSDRIAVIYDGKIVDIVDASSVTREELGEMMLNSGRGE